MGKAVQGYGERCPAPASLVGANLLPCAVPSLSVQTSEGHSCFVVLRCPKLQRKSDAATHHQHDECERQSA